MRIAVVGHEGRLGSELVEAGCLPFVCDITVSTTIQTANYLVNPEVIINCAAMTAVDLCETDDEYYKAARLVNYWGVANLRDTVSCRIIHISSDYVLAGNARGPYKEDAKYDPINSYAMTKLAGEAIFLEPYTEGDLVVRTTGLYGRGEQHDFVKLLLQNKEISVTSSLKGNQTYIPHLAEALIYIAKHPEFTAVTNILHVASRDIVSRYEFALMVASVFGLDKNLIKPVRSNQIKSWVAKRPTRGGLNVKLAEKLGVPIYSIIEGLEALKNERISNDT